VGKTDGKTKDRRRVWVITKQLQWKINREEREIGIEEGKS